MSTYSDLLRSASLSKLAYTVKDVKPYIRNTVVGKYYQITGGRTGSKAFVYKSGVNSIAIAFKGTYTVTDLFNSIDIRKKSFNYRQFQTKVHSGVLNMFEDLEEELTRHIEEEKPKYMTVCGHSIGGSLACLVAAYYGSMFDQTKYVICHTFGSPKVGDAGFAEWFNESVDESVRTVVHGDNIPDLPPFGLSHAQKECNTVVLPISTESEYYNPLLCHDLDTYIRLLGDMSRAV